MKFSAFFLAIIITAIGTGRAAALERTLMISVHDQKLAVVDDGKIVAKYPVSTSRFGVCDDPRSYCTPLGKLRISEKVGYNLPTGAVIKGRRYTGEVLKPNTGGRDPIVTRVLWLEGLENCNRNAHDRGIYIHGTPVERQIGRPASFGCIRMKSRDVVEIFRLATIGTEVKIMSEPLSEVFAGGQKSAASTGQETAKDTAPKKALQTTTKAGEKSHDEHGISGLKGVLASAIPVHGN